MVSDLVLSGLWGFLGGFALLIGAVFGYYFKIPPRIVAGVMAFGSGVLLSAVSFELLDEAYSLGGLEHLAAGFLIGALIFTLTNLYLARRGAKHRKRSQRPEEFEGNGAAIAAGSVIDGIPESIAIGLTMIGGTGVSTATMVAVFLSNIPEGLSSSAGMKKDGWKPSRVFILWFVIAVVTSLSSIIGFTVFQYLPPQVTAVALAIAAGGILAMLVDTMIPEAFSETHNLAGMLTVIGFAISFILSKLY
ncbi:MAG TPA: ZIP family metal transporter [Methanobacteriaceae archaeon]|nr:ZIP family metal transporter [Methanobacteriaceae archaeon]